ncbi:hypothetical protein QI294_11895 [Staphylococcus saprophyticus]|uniref:hypothetical protein n=1 Tax=Staphylococcus sp. GDX8P47P TaxID=2804098 RepID=UPI001AEC2B26|nr:hypothetical protein [Staphylococcus sp. GDX8P47P]MDW4003456.1 hypothetical protein [Staphylococcus saprophyticus]
MWYEIAFNIAFVIGLILMLVSLLLIRKEDSKNIKRYKKFNKIAEYSLLSIALLYVIVALLTWIISK